jgi:hypothetical protein
MVEHAALSDLMAMPRQFFEPVEAAFDDAAAAGRGCARRRPANPAGRSACGTGKRIERGQDVWEVKPPGRTARAGKGKTDDIDALAAARSMLSVDADHLINPRADGIGTAAVRSVGGDVAQVGVLPLAQRGAEAGDLGDRAVRERGHDVLGDGLAGP